MWHGVIGTGGIIAAGLFIIGLGGCGKKNADRDTQPPEPPTAADTTRDDTQWVTMETKEPGKWAAIVGAADIEWDGENRVLKIGIGHDLNGVRWNGELPAAPYELELEARRMTGNDFFCGLTIPVRSESECVTLIVGGWGGNIVGISSINGLDASDNSTGSSREFEDKRWYRIRLEVAEEHLQAWIDDEQVVDAHTEEQRLSLREGAIEGCAPFGLATWLTSAEVRGVKWRKLGD